MNGDEAVMSGGLTDPDDGTRTDVYTVQNGPSRVPGQAGRVTADLKLSTGNGVFTVVNVTPRDLLRLSDFLAEGAGWFEGLDERDAIVVD